MVNGKLLLKLKSNCTLVVLILIVFNNFSQNFSSHEFSSLLINATGAKISGDLYTADSLYKECLKINPKSAVVNFELSGLYRIKELQKQAIIYAEKSVEESAKNEWYLANLAILYKENGEHKKCADIFLELIETQPQKIEYLFSLTEAYLASNKIKKSLKILNQIEKQVGTNEEISVQKHQLYIYIKKKSKALKELEKLIQEYPNSLRNLGLLAEYYESLNKKEKSLILLNKMMDLDSSNGLVRLSMFQHFYKNRYYKKGFYELKKVMGSHEVDEDLKKEILIQISYDQDSPYTLNNVNTLTNIFLDIHPKNSSVLLFFGNLKFLENKEDSACYFLRKSLLLNPNEYDVWVQLISSSLSRGKFEVAIQDAILASENHPNQPFPYFAKGIGLSNTSKFQQAIEELEKGKLLVIDDSILKSDFFHQIADAYYNLNELQKAFKNYEASIDLNPNNPIVLNNYSYYLSIHKQNLERAETLIIKALASSPNSATFLDTYGWILFQKENYKSAEEIIFRAVMTSQENSGEILEHYGDVMFKLGKLEESLLFWNKAKKNGSHSNKLLKKIQEKKYVE